MRYFICNNTPLLESELYELTTFEYFLEWLSNKDVLGLDTETEGFFNHSNRIIMLQISDGKDSFVLDVRNTDYLKRLIGLLEDKLVIGQNLKFDYKFLKMEGIILNNIYDTFLAECILTNGLKSRELGLGALASKYTDLVLDKTVRNQFINLKGVPFTDKQIVYGAEDVEGLFIIREKQLEQIHDKELTEVLNLENRACLALADIEYNGFKLNKEAWLTLASNKESKIPELENNLDSIVINTPSLGKYVDSNLQIDIFGGLERAVRIKWSSPTQVLKVFRTLGLPIESSSEKEIALFQDDYPLIKAYIDYKKEAKLVSTYGKDFIKWVNKETGRIHTEFWQILETFRVSSNNPNLQNLPAKNEYLNCFIAEEGFKIIGIDYAAQEARIAACGSQDELWLATFLEGKDLHSEVCKLMFKIDDNLVRSKPDFLRGKSYRDAAKTINFGVLFGMSKFKLSKSLSISIEEADSLIKQYFNATKQLKSYLDSCANYALKNGYIRSFKPYSGIRYFPDWREGLDSYKDSKVIGQITRASYNTPIQASGALITKLALVKIREFINKNNLHNKVKLIHVVHDAIYCETIESYAEEFAQIQSKLMIEAGEEFNLKLPMLTDIEISDCWSK